MSGEKWVAFAILNLVFLSIYFVPWMTAWQRRHRQTVPIFVLNLFLGWTLLGWVVALVWALTNDKRPPGGDRFFSFTYRNYSIGLDRATGVARIADQEFRNLDAAKIWVDQQLAMPVISHPFEPAGGRPPPSTSLDA